MSPLGRAALVAGGAVVLAGAALAGPAPQPAGHALLDVPYVAQTPELCGGAAVAMVLRYWGERRVHAQDFAAFIGGDNGIRTSTLAAAVRARGWQAVVVPVDEAAARARPRAEIDRGRPLIVLVESGPQRFHYVVLVGATEREVVVHDPARAPFRVLPWEDFDRAWARAGRWALLVVPPDGWRPADAAADPGPAGPGAAAPDRSPCAGLVARSVSLAIAGDGPGCEQGLLAATAMCPEDPAAWRELAGLRFTQGRWSESQAFALVAGGLDPQDTLAWQIVATSRYLTGDLTGALGAWNRSGEPRIDAIAVRGAERTHQPAVVRAAGLEPGALLTSRALTRARRRLGDMPVAAQARVTYVPVDEGRVRVEATIAERRMLPHGWLSVGTVGARALLRRELQAEAAGLLGGGEVASASWRWASERPRVTLGVTVPTPRWIRGVVAIDWLWERQSYDQTPAAGAMTLVRDDRRRIGLQLSDWSTGWLRWRAGVAFDHMRAGDDGGAPTAGERRDVALDTALDVHLAGDRLRVVIAGGWWVPLRGGRRLAAGLVRAAWRSQPDAARPWSEAIADGALSSEAAPRALWPGAGTGQGRNALLRAHPLLRGGVVTGEVFGRSVVHASFEHTRPVWVSPAGSVALAGFVDTAQAWHRTSRPGTSPLFVDAGVGLRLRAPRLGGAIRIDLAHGLRGGGTRLSANWGGPGRW